MAYLLYAQPMRVCVKGHHTDFSLPERLTESGAHCRSSSVPQTTCVGYQQISAASRRLKHCLASNQLNKSESRWVYQEVVPCVHVRGLRKLTDDGSFSYTNKLAGYCGINGLHRCRDLPQIVRALASSSVSQSEASTSSTTSSNIVNKKVVVLGGSGRVGSSTARALVAENLEEAGLSLVEVVISGRSRERGEQLASSIGPNVTFVPSNIDDIKSVESVVEGADLVIHTAGPFQRRDRCTVLEACISTKTPYMDVCDDTSYSKRAKALHERAKDAGVPAITTTGIYPGVSNVIAAELVRLARRGSLEKDASSGSQPSRLRYSYYTAGTGGAGPTILATSFLLLGEEVVAFRDGKEVRAKPYSGRAVVDFGKGIGRRSTYLLNLPEVASAFANLGVPSVSARFGTGPEFWNWAMSAVAMLPKEFLEDRDKVQGLVNLSDPFVRSLDGIVGERMAIRMDLECTDGVKAVGLLSHKSLSKCVGTATSAFAFAMLEGSTEPGVWFPEEAGALTVEARQKLLQRASRGSLNFIMNRPPWMIESTPINIGMGLYWQ